MKFKVIFGLFLLFLPTFGQIAHAQDAVSLSSWVEVPILQFEPEEGDYFMADLKNSRGYLVRKEKQQYTSFPILSGQKRNVYYLGRYYYAATPEKTWEVKAVDIQSDRITFSKSGKFLRLFDNEKRTFYGIHGHKYFDVMNERENKYVSFGCVLVADNVLEIIEKVFEINGNSLKVVTTSDTSLLPF